MKRNLLLFIVLLFGLTNCKKDETSDPKDKLYNSTSWYVNQGNEYAVLGIHENNSMVAIQSDPSDFSVKSIIYRNTNDSPGMQVKVDAMGYPTEIYINENVLILGNYNGTKVDIALIRPNNSIEVFREVQIDKISALQKKKSLNATNEFKTSALINTAGLALSVASCAVSITGTLSTGGVLAPMSAISCGLAIIDIMAAVNPSDDVVGKSIESSSAAWGTISGIFGCASKEIADCAGLLLQASAFIAEKAELYYNANKDNIAVANSALKYGNGDVQVTLSWDNDSDLDLWITDPSGERIYYDHPSSVSGGQLDVDDIDGFGPENIFWPRGLAPNGTYKVELDYYSGTTPSGYTILVQAFGKIQTYKGTISDGQTILITTITSGKSLPVNGVNVITMKSSKPVPKQK